MRRGTSSGRREDHPGREVAWDIFPLPSTGSSASPVCFSEAIGEERTSNNYGGGGDGF